MPLSPISITLSDGQKIEALKRFRQRYDDELKTVEAELTNVLTQLAEAEFLTSYLGEQPEVVELRKRKPETDALEKRRQYLGKIIERLDQVLPKQAAITVPAPNSGSVSGSRPVPGIKRY